MQVQQQVLDANEKQSLYKSKHNAPTFGIEYIYQVDTITLQELVEQLQQQTLIKQIISGKSQQLNFDKNGNLLSQKFKHFTVKQLKKWYQLAKIQLKERQKVQLFALKLMQQDFQNDIEIKLCNINISSVKFGIQPPLNEVNQTLKQGQNKKHYQSNMNSQKQQKHQKKTDRTQQIDPSLKKQQISITRPKIFNPIQMKTLQAKKSNFKVQQDKKVLSKKQFLEMMKFKLNQGSDYKTGTFIKQPLKKNETQRKKKIPQQTERKPIHQNKMLNTNKIKSKSVYFPSTTKLSSFDGKSTSSKNQKGVTAQKSVGRYKTQSSCTSREQNIRKFSESTANLKGKPLQNSLSQTETSRTLPVSRVSQNHANEEKSRIKIKEQQKISTPLEDEFKAQGSKLGVKVEQIHEQFVQKFENKANKLQKDKQILDTLKKEKDAVKDKLKSEQTENQPIFVENQDAYDDEPEVLQDMVILKKQENSYKQAQKQVIHEEIQVEQNLSQIFEVQQIQKESYPQKQAQNFQKIQDEDIKPSYYDQNSQISRYKSSLKNQQLKQSFLRQIADYDIKGFEKIEAQNIKKDSEINTILPKQNQINSKKLPIVSTKIIIPLLKQPIIPKIQYPPYHLHFPTFYHLFHYTENALPNSSNKFSLPHLLKSLEISLESFFKKQVINIAKNQLQNKLKFADFNQFQQAQPQQNIQLKCISELQFIKSTQGVAIFDIDLTSFKKKSMSLLKKVQNNNFDCLTDQKVKISQKSYLKQKQNNDDILLYRVVKNKPEVYDIINTSFYRTQNWLELPHGMELHGCWNLLWTWSKPQIDFNTLIKFQKVNHFPGSKQLARKDLLKKNIEKIKKLSKKLHDYFDIIPDTYFLPGQNITFIKKFRESQAQGRNLWILKPVGLSRGRGISLLNKLEEVVFSEPIVMQKYIHNPFLLDGYKFDLRIYVLVTCINPLQCFIYKQGFARVSTERYCNDLEQIDNKFVHLTNYSIQKDSMKSPGIFTEKEKQLGGCKLTLKMLREKLDKKGIKWEKVWLEIQQVVLKSLISCMKHIPSNPNCFQLLGYDIMLDQDLKCWLIEVNSSPSLEQDFLIDQIVKQQLIDDTIQIVDPINFNREELLKVIKRRRKQVEGMKSHVNYANNSVEQLDEDLFKILNGKILRNYGEIKQHNNFECIAPGNEYFKILKTVQHFTHDPFVKKSNFN